MMYFSHFSLVVVQSNMVIHGYTWFIQLRVFANDNHQSLYNVISFKTGFIMFNVNALNLLH